VNPPPADPARLEPALELLGPMLTADSLEDAAAHATRMFASLSAAEAVVLFLVNGKDTGAEFWVPGDDATRLRFRPHLRGLALEFLAHGAPVNSPFPPEVADGLEPSVLPLLDRGHTLGIVCFAGRGDATAPCSSAAVVVARLMAQHQASSQSQASRARYERWFKQFDSQMRLLERERQKFAAFVNQSDTFVFTADGSRTVRWVNRAAAARFGQQGEGETGWVGRNCDEIWPLLGEPAGVPAEPACPVARAFVTGRPAHQGFRPHRIDGARAYYATALPIRDPDGRPREVLAIVQDLSQLAIVRRMELDLQAVVSSAPMVLFSVDREGVFRMSEGRGLAGLGLRPGEVVGRSVFDVYAGNPEILESVRRALHGEDFVMETREAGIRFETHYTPQRDSAGEIVGVVGVAIDVTARDRISERAREADAPEDEAA